MPLLALFFLAYFLKVLRDFQALLKLQCRNLQTGLKGVFFRLFKHIFEHFVLFLNSF